ncbi:hypothetical protein [Neobacillus novalis]|uniref:hypothetical protein n=1 Tax=Neobacillus novalis TaxID=220687 RepID=UPI000825D034|nr:hypothetical protein [Neobacillus novalis]
MNIQDTKKPQFFGTVAFFCSFYLKKLEKDCLQLPMTSFLQTVKINLSNQVKKRLKSVTLI